MSNTNSVVQTGKPVPTSARKTWSMKKLHDNQVKMIRTDYGGQDPKEVMKNDLLESHPEVANIPADVLDAIVNTAVQREWNQVNGCRKRMKHTHDEISRRLFGTES